MQSEIDLTVITRTLGHLPFLKRCLSSLEAALERDIRTEWIVVDDGCDNPAALACLVEGVVQTQRLKAKIVKSGERHRAKAANAGIAASSGTYVHFLDDDDVVLPGFYGETIGMLDRDRRLGAAAAKCERVVERLALDGESYVELSRALHYPEVGAVTLASLAVNQTLPLVSVLFRRELLEQIGGFDPAFEVCEDYELLLRVLRVADIRLSKQQLVCFHQRDSGGGISANSSVTTDFQAENSYFRNAMLRRDLDEGRIGVGWLLALGELSTGSVKTERILTQLYKHRLLQLTFGLLRRR